jgi:hypothetical protein
LLFLFLGPNFYSCFQAHQYQLQLASRLTDESEASDKKSQEVEELKTALVENKALLEDRSKRISELEFEVEALRGAREAAKEMMQRQKEEAEAFSERVPIGFGNVLNDLESSRSILRLEAARAFIRSPSYTERVSNLLTSDQDRSLRVIIGQLKKSGALPAEYNPAGVINLSLNEDFVESDEEGGDDAVEADPTPDEFESLVNFDRDVRSEADHFHAELDRIRDFALDEMRWIHSGKPSRINQEKADVPTSSTPVSTSTIPAPTSTIPAPTSSNPNAPDDSAPAG